jgi:hypothetical protein
MLMHIYLTLYISKTSLKTKYTVEENNEIVHTSNSLEHSIQASYEPAVFLRVLQILIDTSNTTITVASVSVSVFHNAYDGTHM